MTSFEGENVVAHYVINHPEHAPFVVVYRGPYETEVGSLKGYERLFGPISCATAPPLRTGRWTIVGNVPTTETTLPTFLIAGPGLPPYHPPTWWLYIQGHERPVGKDLPEDLRDLEILQTWSADIVEERVTEGVNHFGYGTRMQYYKNKG